MDNIRPFREGDIPEVAELHKRALCPSGGDAGRREYFDQVFLHNPWRSDAVQSLVNESDDGITGFLGVVPRLVRMDGQSLLCAVSSQFVVDPGSRHRLVGIKLLKTFFAGPQDLSVADEATHAARKVWEVLGGQTAFAQSISWMCPLRPMQAALPFLGDRAPLRRLRGLLNPAARLCDSLILKVPGSPFRRSVSRLDAELLTSELLIRCVEEVRTVLRPAYDRASLAWLFERAAQKNGLGRLQRTLLKTRSGELAGWYMYYLNPGGVCVVVQLFSNPGYTREVLEHLLYHASANGGAAVSGRSEPHFLPDFAQSFNLLWRPGRWMLIHSKKREVMDVFHRGDAFFSRFDGEWCCHFN